MVVVGGGGGGRGEALSEQASYNMFRPHNYYVLVSVYASVDIDLIRVLYRLLNVILTHPDHDTLPLDVTMTLI